MNKALIAAMLAVTAGSVAHLQAQGTVSWGNAIGATTTTSSVRAPVYGPIPGRLGQQVTGNSPTGFPAGTADYGGATLLSGTGFTMGLFAGASASAAMASQSAVDTSLFRTGTSAGFMVGPRTITLQGFPVSGTANLQLRAWDNRGGTVTSWAAVMADPAIAHGSGDVIAVSGLGGPNPPNPDITAAPTLGFRSFNLVQVPEPSLIALGALALGGLLLRRRK